MIRSLVTGLALFASIAVTEAQEPTVLVQNAILIDGTGAARRTADVRFNRDGILDVGELEVRAADDVVDANGRVLAPGFIDTHSHHDRGIAGNPDVTAAVSQGITTIVVGNDGRSELPIRSLKASMEDNPPALNVASCPAARPPVYRAHGPAC